jgi:hypothetical protein
MVDDELENAWLIDFEGALMDKDAHGSPTEWKDSKAYVLSSQDAKRTTVGVGFVEVGDSRASSIKKISSEKKTPQTKLHEP